MNYEVLTNLFIFSRNSQTLQECLKKSLHITRNCLCSGSRDILVQITHAKLFCKTLFSCVKNAFDFCRRRGDDNITDFMSHLDKTLVHSGFLRSNYCTSEDIIYCVICTTLSYTRWCISRHEEIFCFAKHSHNISEFRKKVHF